MPEELKFALSPERLDEGSPEECGAFGLFTLHAGKKALTEGFDYFLNGFRQGPLVSGYHVAEWLAWNWWRLRWEPRSTTSFWSFAHKMTSIGEGYIWPNIEIWSDGMQTVLISNPSSQPDAKPFRYVGATPTILPSRLFEAAIDEFLPQVIGRLREERILETNLDRLWRDLLAERNNPEIAKRRRLEALMGRDPDTIEDDAVEALINDSARLGESAIDEIAAERARSTANDSASLTAESLDAMAKMMGYVASSRDRLTLQSGEKLSRQDVIPAWKIGADAAAAVRQQEGLGMAALNNKKLAQMAGTSRKTLTASPSGNSFAVSYALDDLEGLHSQIVLPVKHGTGRRFALARVIGDCLMYRSDSLHPATRAYTYRQKTQRSFAAELLAPFEAVEGMLDGNYSEDRQQDVADHFEVSAMVINTQLKNHGRIERDQTSENFYTDIS